MTANCAQTEENLINPYISIEYHGRMGKIGVGINTQPFAECQGHLIHPINDSLRNDLKSRNILLYEVHAVVAEYNNPLHEPFGPPKRDVSLFRNERGRIFLGWLEEEIVKKYLPKAHSHLNSDKNLS